MSKAHHLKLVDTGNLSPQFQIQKLDIVGARVVNSIILSKKFVDNFKLQLHEPSHHSNSHHQCEINFTERRFSLECKLVK